MAEVPGLVLDGATLTPESLAAAAHDLVPAVRLDPRGLARMRASCRVLAAAIASGQPVYGVTTGLGGKVGQALDPAAQAHDPIDIVRARAHAAGPPERPAAVRAAMLVRLNTLLRGHAAASPSLATHLAACLNAGLTPVTRHLGSIGASDLAWNASAMLPLLGTGVLIDRAGTTGPAAEMLAAHGLAPPRLAPRDGLALVGNSCGVAAGAALAWHEAHVVFEAAQTAAALSLEAFRANLVPFESGVLAARPQPGQDAAACGIRRRLEGSALGDGGYARRLQDPVSFRNIPQIHGTVAAALSFCRDAVLAEINGSSDNPATLAAEARVVSCGAYFTAELANAVETVSRSFVHLSFGQLARMARQLSPEFSGLPLFLAAPGPAANGLAPLMKTAEALVAELAHAAQPVPLWPSINANGSEDCLSGCPTAVNALQAIAELSARIVGIELIVASRAIHLRGDEARLAPRMRDRLAAVRLRSPPDIASRPLGDDVEALAEAVRQGALA